MKSNVGPIDKAIRLFIALVLIVLFYTNVVTGTLGIIVLVVAAVFLLTGLISFCPLYLPFGINTAKKKK
ncbi:MAG: DUF2892 domain-containing protein [Paludibacter sp.]|nr:DUF2892 domain-containing protein [Paludibacter sp.]